MHQMNIKYPQFNIFWQKCAYMCTFLLQNGALWDMELEQCGIWDLCIVGFVKLVYWDYYSGMGISNLSSLSSHYNSLEDQILGLQLNTKTVFPGIGNPTIKMRQSWNHLIFKMGIPINYNGKTAFLYWDGPLAPHLKISCRGLPDW